jgi:ubiquitin-protein ligase
MLLLLFICMYVCMYCIKLGTICLSILKDEPGGWSPGITIKQLLTGE